MPESFQIILTDEAKEVLKEALKHQTFAEFINAAINQAAPYGDPGDNSDIELARARLAAEVIE